MQIMQFLQDKRYLFWALQAAGWSSWAITFYLGMLVWGHADRTYALYLPIVSALGILLTLMLRALYRATWHSDIGWRVLAVLLGSYLGGAIWMASRIMIFPSFFPEGKEPKAEPVVKLWTYFEGTNSAFMVMVVWSALYFGIKFYMQAQEEQQTRLKATAMAHEAQLKMLHYQLNPHFLFNTLNAISTLILDQHTQLANTMVTRLSRFLRYSLDNDPVQRVTVAAEVDAIKLYLDIEKVRFEERLEIHFNINPAARTALMPSLLLQPLVENSIKHAISLAVNGGSITISALVSDDKLLLSVADDGPGLDLNPIGGAKGAAKGGGLGLANCRERLKEIYGDKQSFYLAATEPHGLTINIVIPFENQSEG